MQLPRDENGKFACGHDGGDLEWPALPGAARDGELTDAAEALRMLFRLQADGQPGQLLLPPSHDLRFDPRVDTLEIVYDVTPFAGHSNSFKLFQQLLACKVRVSLHVAMDRGHWLSGRTA